MVVTVFLVVVEACTALHSVLCSLLTFALTSLFPSVISGKTPHQEASPKWRSFDIVRWIRARRLAWLGHILRLGKERTIKHAIFEMFKERSEGDLLMDAPQHESWRHLCEQACDRERWKMRVRAMKQMPIVSVTMGPHVEEERTMSFTVST